MEHTTNKIDVIKQLFGNLFQENKERFIAEISSQKATVSTVIKSKVISSCARCQSTHFIKNGKRNGKQNFLCRGCKKEFVENTGTILFNLLNKHTLDMLIKLPENLFNGGVTTSIFVFETGKPKKYKLHKERPL